QMRETIEGDIRRHREVEALRAKRNQIGEQLVDAHHFDVPEALVEEELGKSLNNYARYLASQGVDLEQAELDWRKIGAEFRTEAATRTPAPQNPARPSRALHFRSGATTPIIGTLPTKEITWSSSRWSSSRRRVASEPTTSIRGC